MKSADRLEPSTDYGPRHKAQAQVFLDGAEKELNTLSQCILQVYSRC
jgi:hypothetical protein